ncbi:hypothetical protein F4553_007424 [Allocatelliglobosispora scoriae]|uniref:Uncharacterized protein n=1 Tax=Allocatelliglobosispora scoriae TaxID=643052 RepID=A0A841C4V7_9ACTN|nr:hypothetical protein [Allocatelliglobosispora scoriae]MBB5873990.1 hypothetical protein [Allocatelliglobosispora scoriae]
MNIRRIGAAALSLGALLTVAVTSLAFLDNHGYVYLKWFAHPFLGLAVGVVLLALAARVAFERGMLVLGVQWVAAVVASLALIMGARFAKLEQPFAATRGPVVASSDRFQVVQYNAPTLFATDSVTLRLRSRAGIASREGAVDLACFAVPAPGVASASLFEKAELSGPDRLEVTSRDGKTWIITFDAVTLAPSARLDRCSGALPRRP